MEIHSRWGTSEYLGNPNSLKEPYNGKCYAIDFLNQGIRFGFIAGTDTHATIPSGYGDFEHLSANPGFTAVCCQELTRDSIFDAMRTRNCYVASTEHIFLEATIDGSSGGGLRKITDTSKPREIKVCTAAKSEIEKIEIIRNGEVIHTVTPGTWKAEFSFSDTEDLKENALTSKHYQAFAYYYIRVTVSSNGQAWSSPVWLDLSE